MYGFLSNYDETIFLKQSFINGSWVVDYSPVIRAPTSFVKPKPSDLLTSSMVSIQEPASHVVQPQGIWKNWSI
jgi:hypothetical protein